MDDFRLTIEKTQGFKIVNPLCPHLRESYTCQEPPPYPKKTWPFSTMIGTTRFPLENSSIRFIALPSFKTS
jgi:hypothetical protein